MPLSEAKRVASGPSAVPQGQVFGHVTRHWESFLQNTPPSAPPMHTLWNVALVTHAPPFASVCARQLEHAVVSGPAPPHSTLVPHSPAHGPVGPHAQASKVAA